MAARERRERAPRMQRMNEYAVWIDLSENRQDSDDEKERTEASGERRAEEATLLGVREADGEITSSGRQEGVSIYPRKNYTA